MQNARIKTWVPPYTPPGKPDLFYINSILTALWRERDGNLPRLGNPKDPFDDLIYLMLTRRGQIRQAQQLFESLRRSLVGPGQKKPDWSSFLNQGVEAMARRFAPLGMGPTRAREMHAALTMIQERFGHPAGNRRMHGRSSAGASAIFAISVCWLSGTDSSAISCGQPGCLVDAGANRAGPRVDSPG